MDDYPFPKASIQHRFGQCLLELVLLIVTLGIGYVVWSLIILGKGQTPGKQVLKLRVYDATTGKPAKWWHMFIREFGLAFSVSMIVTVLTIVLGLDSWSELAERGFFDFGISDVMVYPILVIDALWIFKGNNRKRLVDVICKTDVLNESAQ